MIFFLTGSIQEGIPPPRTPSNPGGTVSASSAISAVMFGCLLLDSCILLPEVIQNGLRLRTGDDR